MGRGRIADPGRDVEQRQEHLGFLRAGDCVAAFEDKARYGMNAEPSRPVFFGEHFLGACFAGQIAPGRVMVEIGARGERGQGFMSPMSSPSMK